MATTVRHRRPTLFVSNETLTLARDDAHYTLHHSTQAQYFRTHLTPAISHRLIKSHRHLCPAARHFPSVIVSFKFIDSNLRLAYKTRNITNTPCIRCGAATRCVVGRRDAPRRLRALFLFPCGTVHQFCGLICTYSDQTSGFITPPVLRQTFHARYVSYGFNDRKMAPPPNFYRLM